MMPKASTYRLIAFDPGERTGCVTVQVGSSFKPAARQRDFQIIHQHVYTVRELAHYLRDLVGDAERVVYETWRLYADYAMSFIGNDMQPSQVVGMIRYETWRQGKRLYAQGASVKRPAAATMPEWLVAHMDLSSEQHDKDAIMHAWYHAITRYHQQRFEVAEQDADVA